jgi:hypothetical protein
MVESKPVTVGAQPAQAPPKAAAKPQEGADPGINASVVDIPRDHEPGYGEGDGINANIVS